MKGLSALMKYSQYENSHIQMTGGEEQHIRNQILHELCGKKQKQLAKNLHRITRFVVLRLNCM